MMEARSERVTIRWPNEVADQLLQRARHSNRSVSAEVRELLTLARNTVRDGVSVPLPAYADEKSTSVCLTPRLRGWLDSRVRYNDRTLQREILALIIHSLKQVQESEIKALVESLQKGSAPAGQSEPALG